MLQMLLYLPNNLRKSLLMQRRHPSSSLSIADALRHNKLVNSGFACSYVCVYILLSLQTTEHNQTKAD